MDEMQLLRDFAGPAKLPARDDLARRRTELLAATTARRPARRRVWVSVTAAGLAAAATAVLALTPAAPPAPPAVAGPRKSCTGPPRRRAPYRTSSLGRTSSSTPGRGLADGRENEFWASADCTHDGLQVLFGHESEIAGCRDGKRVQEEGHGRTVTSRCEPRPAAHPDLPTDADAVLAYLHKSTYGEGDTLHDLGNDVAAGGAGRALRGGGEGARAGRPHRREGRRGPPGPRDHLDQHDRARDRHPGRVPVRPDDLRLPRRRDDRRGGEPGHRRRRAAAP